MRKKKSEKEKSEKRFEDLKRTLDYLDKKIEGNIKKELPKKKILEKKEKKKKSVKGVYKAPSKKKLSVLQTEVKHFEKELTGNVDYIKRNMPKQKLVSPSELKELIEERSTVLREIIGLKKEIEKLEKERIRLENEQFKIASDQHTERMKEYEDAVKEELIGISENHEKVSIPRKKEKKEKVKVHKVKARKRPAHAPNKLSQSYLNKLNKKLGEIKAKGKK
jgi:hypothetical protein